MARADYIAYAGHYRASKGWAWPGTQNVKDCANPPFLLSPHRDPGGTAMLADLFCFAGWNHLKGYNVLYLDSSAAWYADPENKVPGPLPTMWPTTTSKRLGCASLTRTNGGPGSPSPTR